MLKVLLIKTGIEFYRCRESFKKLIELNTFSWVSMQEIAVSCARLQRNASRTEIGYSINIQLIESSILNLVPITIVTRDAESFADKLHLIRI